MISKTEQAYNIRAEMERNVPAAVKAAKLGLDALVVGGITYIAARHGPEVAQYVDNLMHSPEPLKNIVDFSRGELITYGGVASYMGATIGAIRKSVRDR